MALYSGLWSVLSSYIGLITWIGFAGCTSYFACDKKRMKGVATSITTNLTGIAWAIISIYLGSRLNLSFGMALSCSLISYMIIIQAKMKGLRFIPGAFIGCFATFAVAGEWQSVLPSILIGIFIGYIADITGDWLYSKIGFAEN